MSDKLDATLFQAQTEVVGVDSADFVLDNATYVRIQVVATGPIKVIPMSLVQKIAEFIRTYDIKKEIEYEQTNSN